jgi:hypothetical protein
MENGRFQVSSVQMNKVCLNPINEPIQLSNVLFKPQNLVARPLDLHNGG